MACVHGAVSVELQPVKPHRQRSCSCPVCSSGSGSVRHREGGEPRSSHEGLLNLLLASSPVKPSFFFFHGANLPQKDRVHAACVSAPVPVLQQDPQSSEEDPGETLKRTFRAQRQRRKERVRVPRAPSGDRCTLHSSNPAPIPAAGAIFSPRVP